MANEAAHDKGVTEEAHVISAAVNEDELKPLHDAVRSLPTDAVKDLLSAEVCHQCIFRLFGLHGHICSRPSLSTSVLGAVFREVLELGGDKVDNSSTRKHEDLNGQQFSQEFAMNQKVCPICLGILQFFYLDENGLFVTKDCASDFAATIAEAVKRERHQIDSFSLEVSLPPLVMEKENAVWLNMKKKYSSEVWYQELSTSERVCTKDVFKMSVTDTLGTLLGAKSNVSSFRIRLAYTHTDASTMGEDLKGNNGCNKRRKTGTSEDFVINQGSVAAGVEPSNIHEGERNELAKTSSELQVHGFDSLNFHLEKVSQPCRLMYLCNRSPIYVGGRYLKYSRNVSQSRWIIDDERMGEASVEEIIGSNILPMCGGDSYKFHAAGREDIDVRMLGTGRPFLVEIQNARQVPSEVLIKDMELKINSMEIKLVRVKNLKSLGNKGWDLMREGEAEKQKQYVALVWISRPLNDDDLQTISSLKDMQILQKTPVRVLHRRSPLEREKIIHWMRIERIVGSSQYFLLHLCTQAGTYIKEFVHGDLGRTHPSVGSIFGCRAEILQLDVTDVKMDCFQDE